MVKFARGHYSHHAILVDEMKMEIIHFDCIDKEAILTSSSKAKVFKDFIINVSNLDKISNRNHDFKTLLLRTRFKLFLWIIENFKNYSLLFERNERDKVIKELEKCNQDNTNIEFEYDLLKKNCQHFVSKFLCSTIESPEVIISDILIFLTANKLF